MLLEMEKAVLLELQNVETETDLDVDCSQLMRQLLSAAGGGDE